MKLIKSLFALCLLTSHQPKLDTRPSSTQIQQRTIQGMNLRRHGFIGGLKNNCLPQFTLYLYVLIGEKWIQGSRIWRAKVSKNRAQAGEQFQTDCMGSSEAKFHTELVQPSGERAMGLLEPSQSTFSRDPLYLLRRGYSGTVQGNSLGNGITVNYYQLTVTVAGARTTPWILTCKTWLPCSQGY